MTLQEEAQKEKNSMVGFLTSEKMLTQQDLKQFEMELTEKRKQNSSSQRLIELERICRRIEICKQKLIEYEKLIKMVELI